MTRIQLTAVLAALILTGGAAAIALGALDTGEDEETATASGASGERRSAPRRPVRDCENLKLSAPERSALERRVFEHDATPGSVYFGACEGRYWSMARFEGGGDGVFKDVWSSHPIRLGSVAEAKCDVPDGLLELWRQDGGCKPQPVARAPEPEEPPAESREERCKVPGVKVPNYNPSDDIPDQRLPRPEELLPPKDRCPEAYEGIRGDNRQPNGQRRYPNGRTYLEQRQWCEIMRQQNVPCIVPPPP